MNIGEKFAIGITIVIVLIYSIKSCVSIHKSIMKNLKEKE